MCNLILKFYFCLILILKDCLDWPEEATVKFVSLCKRDTEMTALVSSCVEEEGSLSIIMLYDGNENCYSINELLVHSKFASTDVFVSNGIENGIDSSRDNENGKLNAFISFIFLNNSLYLNIFCCFNF
jgi:hypothetical protein